jgi:hypothetical protein
VPGWYRRGGGAEPTIVTGKAVAAKSGTGEMAGEANTGGSVGRDWAKGSFSQARISVSVAIGPRLRRRGRFFGLVDGGERRLERLVFFEGIISVRFCQGREQQKKFALLLLRKWLKRVPSKIRIGFTTSRGSARVARY